MSEKFGNVHAQPSPRHPTDSAADVIADLAERCHAAEHRIIRAENLTDAAPLATYLDSTGNLAVINLSEPAYLLREPLRKTGTPAFYDARSFIEYFKLHAESSIIYAMMDPHPTFIGIMNDHSKAKPGFRDFCATFTPKISMEWAAWMNRNGQTKAFQSNAEFAQFIQDNAPDIVMPTPAEMLSVALNFRVKSDTTFNQAIRLNDGNVQLQYDNIVTAGSKDSTGSNVTIPERFSIKVPVFDGLAEPFYEVEAMFNFRAGDRKLTLWYDLVRPRKVVQQAFRDLWEKISKETGTTILHGNPIP